ncbi:MAG: hypothetical protein HGA67_00495 [Candidatus Yonathbacteria bacterium]|nr:hypothetical protein [Candidatus Yonathbacteria bacterium]
MAKNSFEESGVSVPVSLPESEKFFSLEHSTLKPWKKLDLALLLLGRKDGAQIGSYQVFEGVSEETKHSVTEELLTEFEDVRRLLESLHLEYAVIQNPEEHDGIFGFSILATRDTPTLSRFVDADMNGDDTAFGRILGYPATAVSAYGTEQIFDPDTDLPEEERIAFKQEGLDRFTEFMFSREHWKEEMAFVRENKELIRKNFPGFYQELVGEQVS